jgi:hypothetical protein
MSFLDSIYIVASIALIIFITGLLAYVWVTFIGVVGPHLPANVSSTVNSSVMGPFTTVNNFIPALFYILSAIAIGATIYLQSNPVWLAIWLVINIAALVVWDGLDDFLTTYAASAANTGLMTTAISFFHNDIPKATVIINVLMGCVLYGKRFIGGING